MPLLSQPDLARLADVAPLECVECKHLGIRNYCRSCDEFFCHCACPPRHLDHRTYAALVAPECMTEKDRMELSKKMSFALRHDPMQFGIQLDAGGWVGITTVAKALNVSTKAVVRVADERSDKIRFTIRHSLMEAQIRAAQGHSVEVDLGLAVVEPPDMLFHGTYAGALGSIFDKGLLPMGRVHVHLTTDTSKANAVGARRGKPVLIQVNALQAFLQGVKFYLADNGVWLSEAIPPRYLTASVNFLRDEETK